MKKDEKFCKILFGAVLLEVGVLGAVGLAIAAAVLRQGSTSGLLRAMENTGVFYPALLLFLAGCAGFYICWEQMKNRGPDYQPKVVWRDDEQTKRVK